MSEEQLSSLYEEYGYPGVVRFYGIVRAQKLKVTLKTIKEFVSRQVVSQLHKRAPNVKEIPITVDGPRTEMQLDLLDMSAYARSNGGMKWILILENVWDRRAYAVACRTKSPVDVLPALQSALKQMKHNPIQIVSDSGSEWLGAVKIWLKGQNISHRTVEVGTHTSLGIIDSFARFIKTALSKRFTASQSTAWVDYLQTLIQAYNDTPHSAFDVKGQMPLAPNQASHLETDVRNINIAKKEASLQSPSTIRLHVSDYVRILKKKKLFDKGYQIKYSIDVFQIVKEDGQWFELDNGGRYREGSLQRVTKPADVVATPTIKDVAQTDKITHKVDSILTHQEGISQSNRRVGLRERKPTNQVIDDEYGRINWM